MTDNTKWLSFTVAFFCFTLTCLSSFLLFPLPLFLLPPSSSLPSSPSLSLRLSLSSLPLSFLSLQCGVPLVLVSVHNDMRFPELAHLYVLLGESGRTLSPLQVKFLLVSVGCQFVCFPGAFNMTTGPAHWELLIHSRWVCVQNPLILSTLHMFLYNCWWPQAVVKFSP